MDTIESNYNQLSLILEHRQEGVIQWIANW